MHKIPVFATISRAYGFLIGDLPTIIRLGWAPILAATLVQYYYGRQVMELAASDAAQDLSRAAELAPINFLLGVVQFLAGIIITVAFLRVVIFGDRKPGLFIYFWFGSSEFRLVLVTILLVIAFIAGAIGVLLVTGILAAISAAVPVLGIVLVVGMFALFFAVIWAVLRLSLIGPVVVSESGLGVERSWALMKGNALRLFIVMLATFVPFGILSSLVYFAVLGGDVPAFPSLPEFDANNAQAYSDNLRQVLEKWQRGFMAAMLKNWEAVNIVGFLTTLLGTALQCGATGSAYRAIVGEGGGGEAY